MEPYTREILDDRGKRSVSLRDSLVKAFKAETNTETKTNTKPESPKHPKTPSSLKFPSYLMNFPFTIDNKVKNNVLMNKANKPYNYDKAFEQFMILYNLIVDEGSLVYLLPSEYPPLQDLPFVANVGAYLPNVKPDTILIANFKSPPRKGEDDIAEKFLKSMNYATFQPPTHWEGEADLKYIAGNLYVGGYGIRTDQKSYSWMADKFDMDIIQVKMDDPKLYHFDCQFFPLGSDKALVSPSAFRPEDLKKIENHMEIVEVPKEFKYDGWTNSILIGNKVFCGDIPNKSSVKAHDSILEKEGFETVGVDLNEFAKSGGDLSCLVAHLSFRGRELK